MIELYKVVSWNSHLFDNYKPKWPFFRLAVYWQWGFILYVSIVNTEWHKNWTQPHDEASVVPSITKSQFPRNVLFLIFMWVYVWQKLAWYVLLYTGNPPLMSLLNCVGNKLLTQQWVWTPLAPCVRSVVAFPQLVFVDIAVAFKSLRISHRLLHTAVTELEEVAGVGSNSMWKSKALITICFGSWCTVNRIQVWSCCNLTITPEMM